MFAATHCVARESRYPICMDDESNRCRTEGLSLKHVLVLLPFLQLATCAIDFTGRQPSQIVILCSASGNTFWNYVINLIWLSLMASLPIGFLSIRIKRVVPFYLLLLGLMPLFFAIHGSLLHHHVLECDAP